ncbi:MAG: GIY-YIG nuclease family protein [Dehalococcoidales bacterium]|nr:GIY-YIG nuclease family protein [Dehalococcoidales bacterium]
MMSDWYLYIIRCYDGSLYTGISTSVGRRFGEHRRGEGAGSKYLKGRGPLTLVFQTRLGSRSLALQVESRVKKLSKARKEKVVGVPGYFDEIVRRAIG